MNNTSQLEKDLRGWTPRRPSEKVKRRIFGGTHGVTRPTSDAAESRRLMPAWSWLAPVGACLFMAVALLNGQRESLQTSNRAPNFATLAASNQSYTASSPNTFEWTNKAILTSSVRSPVTLGTNN